MPHMDGTGPEGKRDKSGRQLGNCQSTNDTKVIAELGKGMGKRRKSGGGEGQQKRLKSGIK